MVRFDCAEANRCLLLLVPECGNSRVWVTKQAHSTHFWDPWGNQNAVIPTAPAAVAAIGTAPAAAAAPATGTVEVTATTRVEAETSSIGYSIGSMGERAASAPQMTAPLGTHVWLRY